MRAIPVSAGIHWVGAIDWNLRDFHGYETPRGTTYNAYLVRGSAMTALVDTVKTPFVPELLARVAEVCDPSTIDLIVVNHVEPDHNSGLRDVMAACPNARVVASSGGVRGVAGYHDGLVVEAVGADDVIDLGGRTLRFMPMPMVHWPDSMFSYCPEDAVLMCNDAFGQHLASAERFADEVGVELALEELADYFANILMPLESQVAKSMEKVQAAGWKPEVIATSHGVIWRGDAVGRAIAAYDRWCANSLEDRVVVAYGTMWGSTDALAKVIADGIASEGVAVELFDLAATPFSKITHALLESRGLILGSPTLHHGMLYRVAGYLQYIAGLKPVGRMGAVFGSFGWSSGATKQMTARLEEIGITMAQADFTQKYRPTEADLSAAREWAAAFARTVRDGLPGAEDSVEAGS
ncbi:MAG: FprA family A-type flavoprotein [Coriobacteriia bacterium]|nr:FprA family A-type flavoprotein [Coriobacteriia bacterium]